MIKSKFLLKFKRTKLFILLKKYRLIPIWIFFSCLIVDFFNNTVNDELIIFLALLWFVGIWWAKLPIKLTLIFTIVLALFSIVYGLFANEKMTEKTMSYFFVFFLIYLLLKLFAGKTENT